MYGSKKQPRDAFGKDTPELHAFYQAMRNLAPGAMKAMQIIQAQWNPGATEHCWTMPDGHRVIAKVIVECDKRIEVDEMHHATFTHRSYINASNPDGLSLAANITHAVDGWIVREMLRRSKKAGFQLATIHDSFWAHPNYMNQVRQQYLDIMMEIARSNMLADILSEIRGHPGGITKLDPQLSNKMIDAEYALS